VTHWPRVHGPAASAGVSCRGSEIGAALWAKWLGKDYSRFDYTEGVKSKENE